MGIADPLWISIIAQVVLVSIVALQMYEGRKMRFEMIKPLLALEPNWSFYTGDFHSVNLVNRGGMIRNMYIDYSTLTETKRVYVPSLGPSQSVSFWKDIKELQKIGIIKIYAKYQDGYGRMHEDKLEIPFRQLEEEGRKLTFTSDPITAALENIKNAIKEIGEPKDSSLL